MSFVLSALLICCDPALGEAGQRVHWLKSFEEAQKKAKSSQRAIMVDFWAPWCGWCHRLDRTTYVDPEVVRLSESFVPVKVNTEGEAREADVALRYDVTSIPTIAFISPEGHLILRVGGYQGPGQFPATMEAARATAAKLMDWERALQRNPDDAEALLSLGAHLFEQEVYLESRELLSHATRVDGGRPAPLRKQTRLLLAVLLRTSDQRFPEAEALLKEALAIRPPGEYDPKILYVLGKTYLSWGRKPEARAAFQEIVKDHAESPVAERARETLVAMDRR
jgi:thioredoxin-related protein